LIIEVDGGCHDVPEQYCYDINRDNELADLGLKVFRFSNEQVLTDIENTLEIIVQEIRNTLDLNGNRKM